MRDSAHFDSMEEWLSIHIEGDGRGHFIAKYVARDQPGDGNTLHFSLHFDQTDLSPMITALRAILRRFGT